MAESCAFTGHRILKDLDTNLLDRVIENLIKGGCKKFLCGMAKGFDLAAAESVLALKKKYPKISLIACVPCEGQCESYSSLDKIRYERILAGCSEIINLAGEYFMGCMQIRDRFMVDNAEVVLSYLRYKSGGTYYTVRYAQKKGKKVIEV